MSARKSLQQSISEHQSLNK